MKQINQVLGLLRSKIYGLTKKSFVRNVAIVAIGTVASQAISMAFSPIVTRLYGPESFGLLGIFMATVSIVVPISALTYPIAIVLPKKDEDAKVLIRLSLYIALLISVLTVVLIFVYKDQIIQLLNVESVASYLYLIPIVMFFSVVLQVIQQWLIRTKQFSITAKVAVAQTFIINCLKIGIGWFNPVAKVLIVLATLSNAIHGFMLLMGVSKDFKKSQSLEVDNIVGLKILAERYSDFPFYRAPQVFINAISQSLPVLMLASFFGPASAGFYTLSKTVLGMPAQLVGKSVGDVFYPRIAEAANGGENLTNLLIKATLSLAIVGFVSFGFIIVLGPWLFGFVFGDEWVVAGVYARWLSIWFFFTLLNRPSVVAIPVLGLQKKFLVFEMFSVVARISSLYIGFYWFRNDIIAIAIFSIVCGILYIFLISWTIYKSKFYYSEKIAA